MLKKSKHLTGLIALLMCFTLTAVGCTPEQLGISNEGRHMPKQEIKVTILPQIESWPDTQIAQKKDSPLALKLDFQSSGAAILTDSQSEGFQMASLGFLPAMLLLKKGNADVIGILSDEGAANAILSASDNAVFSSNKDGINGSRETLQGKTFYLTPSSTGVLLLHKYLAHFGLREEDVTIKTVTPEDGLKAFKEDKQGFLVTWSPFLYEAGEDTRQVVSGGELDVHIPIVLLANRDWLKDHVEIARQYLKEREPYVAALKKGDSKTIEQLQQYFYSHDMPLTESSIRDDVKRHRAFNLNEQKEAFSNGYLEKMLLESAALYVKQEKFTEKDLAMLKEAHFYLNPEIVNG